MGVVIPLVAVTAFWLLIGVGGPFLVPKGPNRGVFYDNLSFLPVICQFLTWFDIYLHQLNPLIGPQINVKTIRWISLKWGDSPTPV
ncbi:hypothetical protein Angca_004290, partial [Angiostrongylus cantonensis]